MIKNDHVLHAGLTLIIIQHALVTSLYHDFYNSLLHTFSFLQMASSVLRNKNSRTNEVWCGFF